MYGITSRLSECGAVQLVPHSVYSNLGANLNIIPDKNTITSIQECIVGDNGIMSDMDPFWAYIATSPIYQGIIRKLNTRDISNLRC